MVSEVEREVEEETMEEKPGNEGSWPSSIPSTDEMAVERHDADVIAAADKALALNADEIQRARVIIDDLLETLTGVLDEARTSMDRMESSMKELEAWLDAQRQKRQSLESIPTGKRGGDA